MKPTAYQIASNTRRAQHGAALVVSLLLLLVMTILALSMSQTTRLQERMAGSNRDAELALQAADTALRGAETYLIGLGSRPEDCDDPKVCKVVNKGTFDTIDLGRQSQTWWLENSTEYGTVGTKDLPVDSDPRYVIEYYDHVKQGLSIGRPQQMKVFYKATAHSYGGTKNAEAVLESVYAFIE